MLLARSTIFLVWCFSGTMALGDSQPRTNGSIPGWNTLVYLIYKLEVTNYCSLTTDRTILGFRQKYRMLTEHYQLDRNTGQGNLVELARSEAWNLAYKEWDNRGLGGFRRWCKKEASRYKLELESVEDADVFP